MCNEEMTIDIEPDANMTSIYSTFSYKNLKYLAQKKPVFQYLLIYFYAE